jgi:hypothetical protein
MILNLTKKSVLSEKVYIRKGFGKFIGLLTKKKAETIVFKTRFGIHTFFLTFPIDLVVLSKEKKVVFIKENVTPNKIVIWNIKYNEVIELPKESIKKSNTQIGDILEINL